MKVINIQCPNSASVRLYPTQLSSILVIIFKQLYVPYLITISVSFYLYIYFNKVSTIIIIIYKPEF